MGKRKTTEQFINEAKKLHKLTYDYNKVEYKTTDNHITIICPVHGEFKQTPRIHLMGSGCNLCYREEQKILMTSTTEEFIKRSISIHGKRYGYEKIKYVDALIKVKIVCDEHGTFTQTPNMHLSGQGCPECGKMISGRRKTTEQFIKDLKKIYKNKFDYSLINYANNKIPVTIICKQHGAFTMRPDYLLDNKISCPECVMIGKKDVENRRGGYCKSFFDNNPTKKNQKSIFYIVKLKNNNEEFIKIGITTQKLKYRFPKMRIGNYKVEIVDTKYLPLYEAYNHEQQLIRNYNQYQYYPANKFDGWTECFNLKIPLKSIS